VAGKPPHVEKTSGFKPIDRYPHTDTGNAERFVARHGNNFDMCTTGRNGYFGMVSVGKETPPLKCIEASRKLYRLDVLVGLFIP
jgi:hypothetical protein